MSKNVSLRRIVEEIDLYINETITYSHSVNISIGHLERMWNYDNSVEYYKDKSHPNSILVQFNKPISEKDFNNLISHINDYLGYVPSFITSSRKLNISGKYNDNTAKKLLTQPEKWGIYFDAKYDKIIDESKIPDLLYHISPSKHEEKILKIGFVPKTKNKMAKHPERIYLAYKKSSSLALLNSPQFTGNDTGFTLYEINYGEIKNYREIKFMEDPQYPNEGCYTYENIPPQYIKVIERISV